MELNLQEPACCCGCLLPEETTELKRKDEESLHELSPNGSAAEELGRGADPHLT